jgi:hypothetical protein
MHQSLVKFSESEASNHTPSLVDFTTTTPELKFSVHTTAEEDAEFARLAANGLRREEIARLLDRTVASIEGHAIRLGIQMASFPGRRDLQAQWRGPSANPSEPTTAAIDRRSNPTARPKRGRAPSRQ